MSGEKPKRVIIRDRIVREVLRDAGKREQKRQRADEEVSYVDANRSISVVLGSADLGADIKAGKRSENYEPAAPNCEVYFTQAKNFMARKNNELALEYLRLALGSGDMKSSLKSGILCAMAQCYLDLGEFETSKMWAEDVLKSDPNYIPAIHIKGESLYNICDFEHAMVVFYTGLRLMKTHSGFKSGIVKSKKTILNTLDDSTIFNFNGCKEFIQELQNNVKSDVHFITSFIMNEKQINGLQLPEFHKSHEDVTGASSRSVSRASSSRPTSSLGSRKAKPEDRLKTDKEYLKLLSEGLLINCKDDFVGKVVSTGASKTMDFLNNRNKFWEQVQVKRK